MFPDVVRTCAARTPGAPALRLLPPGHRPGDRGTPLTWRQLDERARAVAAGLARHVGPRARVLVLAGQSEEFVLGVLGCLYAGVVAVGAAPDPAGSPAARHVYVAENAEVEAVLTTRATGARDRGYVAGRLLGRVPWLVVEELTEAGDWTAPVLAPDDLALLQYTSGSTGAPKAVAVSHRNLLAQLDNFRDLTALPAHGTAVSWMPVHHALGLGLVLLALYQGGEAVLLRPDDFVDHPYRWLRAISDASGPVIGAGPNFAYERCARQVTAAERARLDLTRWHTALAGGERNQPRTLRAFADVFRPAGLDPWALFPAYGLTETMQIVVGRHGLDGAGVRCDSSALQRGEMRPAAAGAPHVELCGCGPAGPHAEITIVDPATATPVPPGRVGEVWLRGDAVCRGYWRRAEETEATFGARLAGGEGPYLRTGDLAGRHGDDLVLCGRLKELIIVRGRNLHPQDVEQSVQRAAPVLAGRPAAAFSADGPDGERLIVVQAIDPADAAGGTALVRAIRRSVALDHEVEPAEVLLVSAEQVPLTPSGKVRRTACREAWLRGELRPLAGAGPAGRPGSPWPGLLSGLDGSLRTSVVLAELRRRIGEALRTDPGEVPAERPLGALGLAPHRAGELRDGIADDFGARLPVADLLRHGPARLAELIVATIPPAR